MSQYVININVIFSSRLSSTSFINRIQYKWIISIDRYTYNIVLICINTDDNASVQLCK